MDWSTEVDVQTAEDLGKQVVVMVKGYVARALAPLSTRLSAVEVRTGALAMLRGTGAGAEKIAALEDLIARVADQEARLKALEARPTVQYMGVWRAVGYEAGSVVTFNGSMWHAQRTTIAKPGSSPDDWVLCAKGGKGVPRETTNH